MCDKYIACMNCDCALCANRREVLARGSVFLAASHIAAAACTGRPLGRDQWEELKWHVSFIDALVEATIAERGIEGPTRTPPSEPTG